MPTYKFTYGHLDACHTALLVEEHANAVVILAAVYGGKVRFRVVDGQLVVGIHSLYDRTRHGVEAEGVKRVWEDAERDCNMPLFHDDDTLPLAYTMSVLIHTVDSKIGKSVRNLLSCHMTSQKVPRRLITDTVSRVV